MRVQVHPPLASESAFFVDARLQGLGVQMPTEGDRADFQVAVFQGNFGAFSSALCGRSRPAFTP
jgi:hypothetical protein